MERLHLRILNYAFSPQNTDELRKEILMQEYFYLPFNKKGPFIIDKITLPVFLQENDAAIYAQRTAFGYEVKTVFKKELLALISELNDLKEVKFYSNIPIHITFHVETLVEKKAEFIPQMPPEPSPESTPVLPEKEVSKTDTQESSQKPESLDQKNQTNEPEIQPSKQNIQPVEPDFESSKMTENGEAAEKGSGDNAVIDNKKEFKGVDKVREYFSILDAAGRRKIDPGYRFLNIHTLVETLYQQNGLDPLDIDKALGFVEMNGKPSNFTYHFIKNPTEKAKKDIVLKYLRFFGLEEYWLAYQDCCPEIKNEIKQSPELDQMKLKFPPKLYAERFQLTKFQKLKYDGGLVYRVTLTGETDTVEFNVTNPMQPALKVGKSYQLLDKNGEERTEDKKRKEENQLPKLLTKDDIADVFSETQKKKPSTQSDQSFDQIRKNKIIFYLKDKLKLQRPSAESKFKEFECDSDILNEFYQYIEYHKFGNLEVQGYTARRLMKELKITEPYEAFHYLLELRNSPGETKQKLKLLEGSLKAKRMENAARKNN